MTKYQNNIQTIEYDSSKKFVTQTWTKASEKMKAENFKTEMLELAKIFEQTQPEKVLIDMQNFFFVVVPELQEWVSIEVNSKLAEMDKTKTAYIVSPDLFASVSVAQTLDESAGKDMNHKFFDKEKEARSWLME